MKLKQISNQHRNCLLNISGFIAVSLFFLSGIGSYRILLVYGFYSILQALKIEQKILFIFAPAYIVTFYLDVTNGPLFSHFAKSYIFIVLPAFVVADYMAKQFMKKLIGNITQNQYFVECPSCHFNNIHLVETCANCSYKKDNPLSMSTAKIAPSLRGDKIPSGLLDLLTLEESEKILFHKKLTRNIAKFKNGVRQARKYIVITTVNLIILDYYSFHIRMPKSWREKDIVPLSDILAVEGRMKKFYMAMRPFLIIRTIHNDIYEIVLPTYGKYVAEINEIAVILKKANPQVEIIIELAEKTRKDLFKNFR